MAGVGSGKSLGLFCFKKEDAEALLDQMRSMNQDMRQGSKVVALALNKVRKIRGIKCRNDMNSLCNLMFLCKVDHLCFIIMFSRECLLGDN